jgi:hypothetical protein
MNIKKYTALFHDGEVIEIKNFKKQIELTMESAEVDPDDIKDEIILSMDDTIKGKLYIKNINKIIINEKPVAELIKKKYDMAKIFDFEINNKEIQLSIIWKNYPPKSDVEDFSKIEIEADKIWWENIPDLVDPFE